MALMAVPAAEPAPDGVPTIFPNWESRVYQYEREAAAEAGFAVGSVKITSNYRLLVMDTARSVRVEHNGWFKLWGFGFRFLVEVSDISLVGKLTLAAIAGAMEVSEVEANVRLEIKGYKGDDMWDVVPPPRPLDVDTYRTYMTAVEKVQKAFKANPQHAYAVLLAEGPVDGIDMLRGGIDGPDVEAAILVVWALKRLESGTDLEDALTLLGRQQFASDSAQKVVTALYEMFLEDDLSAPPNSVARARASDLLSYL